MTNQKISSKFYRDLVFVVGIIATFAYRAIVVLNHLDPIWVSIAWYVGTLGFVWYFAHRFRVENKREKLAIKHQLAVKVENLKELSAEDKDALNYILKGLSSSKARWNYIIIFVFSALALLYGIYLDFIFPDVILGG